METYLPDMQMALQEWRVAFEEMIKDTLESIDSEDTAGAIVTLDFERAHILIRIFSELAVRNRESVTESDFYLLAYRACEAINDSCLQCQGITPIGFELPLEAYLTILASFLALYDAEVEKGLLPAAEKDVLTDGDWLRCDQELDPERLGALLCQESFQMVNPVFESSR